MKLVTKNREATLAAVRALSESAILKPIRTNRFVPLAPTVLQPAAPDPIEMFAERAACHRKTRKKA